MMEKIVGHTLTGVSIKDKKTVWTQTYEPHKKGKAKGKVIGDWAGEPYTSQWYIKKGKWCESWEGGQDCWELELVDNNQLQVYKKGELLTTWTIVE